MKPVNVHKTLREFAVLGAGTMGSQIAAVLANAGFSVRLFDLGSNNQLVLRAIEALHVMQPPPFVHPSVSDRIVPANYEVDIAYLRQCDCVIEAIAERLHWKQRLYEKILPYLHPDALLVSNTAALHIAQLSEILPPERKPFFCGMHFFPPARQTPLVELIPHTLTHPETLDTLEYHLVHHLGKNVLRATDSPGFLANRLEYFALLICMHHAEAYGMAIDVADHLTAACMGRGQIGVFAIADRLGLDQCVHIAQALADQLPDDPWAAYFQIPYPLKLLVERGALGEKTGHGFYTQHHTPTPFVFDNRLRDYRLAKGRPSGTMRHILQTADPHQQFRALWNTHTPESEYMWAIWRDLFHYTAHHAKSIADSVADIDLALKWGFGWKRGIFETWQTIGWESVISRLESDRRENRAAVDVALPTWVQETANGPYRETGSFHWKSRSYAVQHAEKSEKIRNMYAKQWYPSHTLPHAIVHPGDTLWRTPALRLWTRQCDIGILSFTSPFCILEPRILDNLLSVLEKAENSLGALIWWQAPQTVWHALRDLHTILKYVHDHEAHETLMSMWESFHAALLRIRHLRIPFIAALNGSCSGPSCAIALFAHRIVATENLQMGFSDIQYGLFPGWGGITACMQRAGNWASEEKGPLWYHLQRYAEPLLRGTCSDSGTAARIMGYLQETDRIIAHPEELLWAAHTVAQAEWDLGYQPPRSEPLPIGGQSSLAQLHAHALLPRENADRYPQRCAELILETLCGGPYAEAGDMQDTQACLALERQALLQTWTWPETYQALSRSVRTEPNG